MIFVSDLDKTLLRSDLSISDFTKNIWNNFKYPLTIATARSYTGVKTLLNGLKLNLPLILLDGAMISMPDGEILKINAINKDLADEIIDSVYRNFKDYPLIVGFNEVGDEKFLYPKKLNIYQKELLANYKNDNRVVNIENLRGLNYNLKIVYLGEYELISQIENFIKTNFNVETKMTKDPYIDCYFLTILHPLSDKANALKELEEELDIDKKDVYVFGDSINDIGMFEYADVSIAVKNALNELKQKADIVLPHTNDEDAVAKFLKEIK